MQYQVCSLICALVASALLVQTFRDSDGSYDIASSMRITNQSVESAGKAFAEWSTRISTMPNHSADGATLTLTAGKRDMALVLRNDGPRAIKVWARGSEDGPALTLADMHPIIWNVGNPMGGEKWCGTGSVVGYVSLRPGQSYVRKLSYDGLEFHWQRNYANQVQASVSLWGDVLYSNPVKVPAELYRELQRLADNRPREFDPNGDGGVVKDEARLIREVSSVEGRRKEPFVSR